MTRNAFDREAILLTPDGGATGPFALDDSEAFSDWHADKLRGYPRSAADLVVALADPADPTAAELAALKQRVAKCGMAVFSGPAAPDAEAGKAIVQSLGSHLGLHRLDQNPYADEDAISPLHVAEPVEGGRRLYIPYTDKPISWHTDGYYNEPDRRIRAMVLYTVRPALEGGENALFDPELAYLRMRDADPAMVAALAHPEAMTIPGNDMDDHVQRGDVTGPVFSLNKADGSLHMRYTARKRNIRWRDDSDTARAVQFLSDLLGENGEGVFHHRMAAGQGLVCNNVLHTRTGFKDGAEEADKRMVLRARYLDRIA